MAKFELSYPIKPLIITQKFGETAFLQYYKDNGIIFNGHNGIDMAAKDKEVVFASHEGIAYTEVDKNQGHGVFIVSENLYDYKDQQVVFKTIYWHMVEAGLIPSGTKVKTGDFIGYADNTGLSTGSHLHFALKPLAWKSPMEMSNLEPNNGYYGAIDPTPYFNGKYAQDNAWRHTFYFDMELGDESPEVALLQKALQIIGYFPAEQIPTGYYGSITKAAVFNFQKDYVAPTSLKARLIVWSNWGRYCSTLTRKALNQMFA